MSKLIKLTIEVRVLDEQKLRVAAEQVLKQVGVEREGDPSVTGDLIMATTLSSFWYDDLEGLGVDVENETAEIVEEEDV